MPCGTSGACGIAGGRERPDATGDRVGHRVRHVNAGVAERDAGERRGPHHLLARLGIARVAHGAHEVLRRTAASPRGSRGRSTG